MQVGENAGELVRIKLTCASCEAVDDAISPWGAHGAVFILERNKGLNVMVIVGVFQFPAKLCHRDLSFKQP